MGNTNFIETIAQGAIKGWHDNGILPSLSLAQAILESGWGQSGLAQEGKNLFGIKASTDWTGDICKMPTQEWDGTKYITIMADFRAYPSWADSVEDHARFFTNTEWRKQNYAAVIGETDYKKACYAIKAAGYATAPDYAEKLIRVIEENNLMQYDNLGGRETMEQAVGSSGQYEYITGYDSYNYNGNASTDAIVVHHWGEDGQNFDNICGWLCNPNQPSGHKGSAHYVVEENKVACLIAPGLRAWHVASNDYQQVMQGIYDINSHTIGIECRPECTQGDLETLAQLIADLWKDYGKIPIYYHKQFMSTACAGRYIEFIENGWLEQRAEFYYNGGIEMRQEVVQWLESLYDRVHDDELKDWEKDDLKQAIEMGITTGERPHDIPTRSEVAIMVKRGKEK